MIITISREFGSGGRELGKRLADALGYAYYDKEILEVIAKQTETDESYIEKILDGAMIPHVPLHFGCSFSYYSPITQNVVNFMVAEQNAIKLLASKGDCVMVGRGASTVLEEKHPFNIFVYADMASKVARCRKYASTKENMSDKELEKKIRQVDSARAKGQERMSDFKWGEKEGYHLCINTSGLCIKKIIPLITEYAKYWLKENSH